MTRSEEGGEPADELPSFSCASWQQQDAPATADLNDTQCRADEHLDEAQHPPAHEPLTPDHLDHAPTRRAPHASPRAWRADQAMRAAGLLCFAAAIVGLATPHLLGADSLTLDAALVATCTGAVLVAMSRVQRHQELATQSWRQGEESRTRGEAAAQRALDDLLAHALADADEFIRLRDALRRQDQELGRLAEASKMYGKPLVEIAAQTAQLSDQVSAIQQRGGEAHPDSEAAAKSIAGLTAMVTEMRRQLSELNERFDEALTRSQADQGEALASSIRDVQREIGALTTAMTRPPEAASEPATPTATTSGRDEPAAPAGEVGGYSAGARTSDSAGVLSAIAKLRQMKR